MNLSILMHNQCSPSPKYSYAHFIEHLACDLYKCPPLNQNTQDQPILCKTTWIFPQTQPLNIIPPLINSNHNPIEKLRLEHAYTEDFPTKVFKQDINEFKRRKPHALSQTLENPSTHKWRNKENLPWRRISSTQGTRIRSWIIHRSTHHQNPLESPLGRLPKALQGQGSIREKK